MDNVFSYAGCGLRPTILFVFITAGLAACTASDIDTCLDRGGSFDYEHCRCDFRHSHAYRGNHDC